MRDKPMIFKRLLLSAFFLLLAASVQAQVVLRLSASNPSKFAATEVEVKQLLPPGIQRGDVLDAGGLEVVYDADAKRYCVTKKVELQPGQKVSYTVQLRDIWVFDENELKSIDGRAQEISGILAPTRAANEAKLLRDRIGRNVAALLALQAEARIPEVSVPEHISAYDRNAIRFAAVQEDAKTLEEVLSIVGNSMIIEDFPDGVPPNVGTLWKIILVVVSFVGILSLGFFFVWAGQLKKIRQAEREAGIA